MSRIPSHWTICSLKEIIELFSGFAFKSKEYSDSGVPILRMGNITKNFKVDWTKKNQPYFPIDRLVEFEKYKLEGGEIVICLTDLSESGAYLGTVAIVEVISPVLLNQRLSKIIFDKDSIDKKYLYFALCEPSFRNYMISDETGSLQKNTSHEYIYNYKFKLAPLNEQRRIVAKLEKLLAKVDTCKERLDKIPAILKRFRQSVLAAACSGRLTADWRKNNPDVESAEELLKRIWDENTQPKQIKVSHGTPDPFDLPKQWKWVKLFDICRSITDGDHQPPPKSNDGVPFLTISNITTGKLDFNQIRYVPEDYYQAINETRKPYKGDILYTAVDATYGIPVLVDTEKRFCFQRHIAILKPSFLISNKYVLYILKSNFVYKQATDAITGIAQPTVPLSGLRQIKVPLAPLQEQQEIASRVETLFKIADRIEQRYQKAKNYVDQLTQSILAKAFRGELVPQDPNDEPASVLLERIRTEREKREAEAKTAKKSTSKKGKQRNKKAEQQELEAIQLELPLSE